MRPQSRLRGLLAISIFFVLSLTSPLPASEDLTTASSPDTDILETRAPVSADGFADWDTNVVMQASDQSYGFYIKPDKSWHDLKQVQCLDWPAYAIGPCNLPTVSAIGVKTGSGPCSFVGINGFRATLSGNAGQGFVSVGPPQQIILAACG